MHYLKTQYKPHNFLISDQDREFAFWLLQKRTSITFITKIYEAINTFTKGYELFVSKVGATPKRRHALAGFFEFVSHFEEGLALLNKGRREGYHDIYNGTKFVSFLHGREFEMGYHFVEIGYRDPPKKSIALYALAERTMDLCRCFGWSFSHSQFPLNSWDEKVYLQRPTTLAPIPKPQKVVVESFVDLVPISGIYMPLHPWGCPTYLIEGIAVPKANIPSGKGEAWKSIQDMEAGMTPTSIDHFSQEISTKWTLLWKDDRYPNGHIPDESEYLDPSMEIPSDSLLPPEAKEEDFF